MAPRPYWGFAPGPQWGTSVSKPPRSPPSFKNFRTHPYENMSHWETVTVGNLAKHWQQQPQVQKLHVFNIRKNDKYSCQPAQPDELAGDWNFRQSLQHTDNIDKAVVVSLQQVGEMRLIYQPKICPNLTSKLWYNKPISKCIHKFYMQMHYRRQKY